MDWQIRVALIIFGFALVAFIYYDFSKKKKIKKDNEKLKKQFSNLSRGVDSTGFDSDGVGKPRSKASNSINQPSEKIEPRVGDIDDHETETETEKDRTLQVEQKVFSLIIQSEDSAYYKGSEFMPLLLSQGFKFGEMNIFHRYKSMGKNPGKAIVSLASAVEPGTFDLENIDVFTTPAFAIFSTFSGDEEYLHHYKNMVKTSEFLIKELGGKLLNQSGELYTQESHRECLDEITKIINQMSTH